MSPTWIFLHYTAVALAGIEPAMSPYEGGALPLGDRASAPDRIRTGNRPLDRRVH